MPTPKHMIPIMTLDQAQKIVGKREPSSNLRMMIFALKLHPWINSEEENKRLQAARIVMRHRTGKWL